MRVARPLGGRISDPNLIPLLLSIPIFYA